MTTKDRLPIPVSFPEGIHLEGLEKNLKGEILGLSREELETKLRELSEIDPGLSVKVSVKEFLGLLLQERLEELERGGWSRIKQNSLINDLAIIRTVTGRNTELLVDRTSKGETDKYLATHAGKVTVEHRGGALDWTHGLQRVLQYMNILHTRAGGCSDTLVFTAREYADYYGLSNYTRAHKEVREALETLKYSNVKVTHKKDWGIFSILSEAAYGDRRGEYIATFSPTIHTALKNGLDMYTLVRAWQVNPKLYPYATTLYQLFSIHQRRNLHREAGLKPRLTVKYLLEKCPQIPTYEELEAKGREYKARIITPFERNLDRLVDDDIFISWRYCKPGGEALTEEEEKRASQSYTFFITLNIEAELHEHPELAKEREKAIARRAGTEENEQE